MNTRVKIFQRAAFLAVVVSLTACPPGGGDGKAESALLLLLGGGGGISQTRPCAGLTASTPATTSAADTVTSAPASTGFGYEDSYCAINGVRGLGSTDGSVDVFSLATSGAGASIVLEWSGRKVTDGTGADFIVYENAFNIIGGGGTRFMEPIVVEVSRDNVSYCGWNPAYSGGGTYSNNPANWTRFAGVTPVTYNQDTNPLTAGTLIASGGGDAFDLNDGNFGASGSGCDITLRNNIRTNGFLYVRLTAATARGFPGDTAGTNGPDIDGVIAVSTASRP